MNKTIEALKQAKRVLENSRECDAVIQALAAVNEAFAEQPNTKGELNVERNVVGLAEPVKQEPIGENDLQDVRCECCGYMTHHREHIGCIRASHNHTAPVDAKAIRAEALEEAAKVCDEISVDIPYNCAAAIRGLK